MNGLETQGQRIVWRRRHQTLRVEPWGPDSIRMRATMNAMMPELPWSLLPAGAEWSDAWTGANAVGGRRRVVAAPLGRIPVFVRGDAEIKNVFREG